MGVELATSWMFTRNGDLLLLIEGKMRMTTLKKFPLRIFVLMCSTSLFLASAWAIVPTTSNKPAPARRKPLNSRDSQAIWGGGPRLHADIGLLPPSTNAAEFLDYRVMEEIQLAPFDSKLALAATAAEALRRGYYDIAINTARKGVAEAPKPWEENNDAKLAPGAPNWQYYLQFLAVAHELKGDWLQAQELCAAAYGPNSSNGAWLNARIFYSSGETDAAFFYLMQVAPRLQDGVATMENFKRKVETGEIAKRVKRDGRRLRAYYAGDKSESIYLDSDWKRLYAFRDSCARIVCPELHFTVLERTWDEAFRKYDALWDECWQRFLAFAEAEFAALPSDGETELWNGSQEDYREKMEFLRELDKLPL